MPLPLSPMWLYPCLLPAPLTLGLPSLPMPLPLSRLYSYSLLVFVVLLEYCVFFNLCFIPAWIFVCVLYLFDFCFRLCLAAVSVLALCFFVFFTVLTPPRTFLFFRCVFRFLLFSRNMSAAVLGHYNQRPLSDVYNASKGRFLKTYTFRRLFESALSRVFSEFSEFLFCAAILKRRVFPSQRA